MSLIVGEKNYSDKELADAYRQQLKEYNDWCLQKVQKFFITKKTRKHYNADVYFPEVEEATEISLTVEEVAKYTEFEKEERAAFEKESDSQTEQDWIDWLHESYYAARFLSDDKEVELRYVDLRHPINVYCFQVKHFSYEKPKDICEDVVEIALSDEQYICLVAKCMQESDFTMAKLLEFDPALYKHIVTKCTRPFSNQECAIFLTEAKEDAKAILQSAGENMPPKPDGFFAGIAEHLSNKQG